MKLFITEFLIDTAFGEFPQCKKIALSYKLADIEKTTFISCQYRITMITQLKVLLRTKLMKNNVTKSLSIRMTLTF